MAGYVNGYIIEYVLLNILEYKSAYSYKQYSRKKQVNISIVAPKDYIIHQMQDDLWGEHVKWYRQYKRKYSAYIMNRILFDIVFQFKFCFGVTCFNKNPS